MFRYTGKQRLVARAVVRGSQGWPAWAAARGIVSRELTRDELNQAIDDLNLRLPLLAALRRGKLLPIWDRSMQSWVPLTHPVKAASVQALKTPDEGTLLLPLLAEAETKIATLEARDAEKEARIQQLEIWCGLRVGDPHELDDVGAQKSYVREQYDAFATSAKGWP